MKELLAGVFLSIFILLFISCSEQINTPDVNPVIISIESIIPDTPLKIGEKFKVIVRVENLNGAFIDHRYFINNQFHFDNVVKGDTIFTYLPYVPTALNEWVIKVSAFTLIGNEFHYYYTQDTIDVIPENCPGRICLKWSDLDTITEYESYYHPEIFGDQYRWICETNEDTVIIFQRTPGSDEGYEEVKIKFLDKGLNNLPEHLELTKFVYDLGSQVGDTLKSGIIKIQEWDVSGIISGIILSELEPIQVLKPVLPTRRVFWFNFSK